MGDFEKFRDVRRSLDFSKFPIPHSPAKFQNSPANSPSLNLSSPNQNVQGMGNGKRDLTHSKLIFIKSRNGVHRPPRGVEFKVNALMASYKKTKDWINNTGQGVLLEDGEVSFRELVTKKFPYFYDRSRLVSAPQHRQLHK